MSSCPRCGAPADGASLFCGRCGAALDAAEAPRQEMRKTVTVLFCDVVDSTVLGEGTDPETVRRAMSRFFDEMRTIVERHGGIVERFRGDEVMAVFGVPTVHEDDALRAVRSAAAMRQRLKTLNEELLATWNVELRCRIGINTGEVVAGDPGTGATFVTGDAVNLAKRLEQAASAGEILIGTATYPLVKDAVKVGPRERFTVKGKRDPVSPFRLDDVDASAAGVARRLDAQLVGRGRELAALEHELAECVRERQCRLVTVIGAAGIGKSRLAAEVLTRAEGRVQALIGRCLPYGEAITFWPLVEIFRSAGGEESLACLDGVEDGAAIADVVRSIAGETGSGTPAEETFWAVRRYLEELARGRPLVVVFEDVQWAAPTLLDLVEYLAGWMRGAPVLLLVLARSDLLDSRPSWAAPRANATLMPLEPLSARDAERLLGRLGTGAGLSTATRQQIASAAEGNPLFLEQMVAMADETPEGAAVPAVPPTIQALLAERLDRLSTPERALLERASVFGREFSYRTIVELSPPDERDGAATHLFSLIRKDLFHPVRSEARDDLLAFRHDLIRAAAYDAMPKILRAELHERLGGLLEENAGNRLNQLGEVVGYHFERAYHYLAELRYSDARTMHLADRAAYLLASAGRRSGARGDEGGAAALLSRAVALPGNEERRVEWLLDLATALRESGELGSAAEQLEVAAGAAAERRDPRLQARAEIEQLFLRVHTDPVDWPTSVEQSAPRAIDVLDAAEDDFGLARAWTLVALAQYFRCQVQSMETMLEAALEHARRAGDGRQASTIVNLLARAPLVGPMPASEALTRCAEIEAMRPMDKTVEAVVLGVSAVLEAMLGNFESARGLYRRSHEIYTELGKTRALASARAYSGAVELLAGDPLAAEHELRTGCDVLRGMGDTLNLSTGAAILAEALLRQGRSDEALEFTVLSEETSSPFDVFSEAAWRTTRARILAGRGERETACLLAADAVDRARATDNISLLADALLALGELSGIPEGVAALREARSLYETKENSVGAAGAERALERLAVGA